MSTGTGSGGQSLTSSGSAGWSPPALGHSQSFAQQLQGSAILASGGLATTPPTVGLNNDHNNSYGSGLGSGLTSAATTTSSGLTVSPALLAGNSPSFPSLGQTQTTPNEPYLGQNAAVFDLSDFPALGVGMSASQGLGNTSQTSLAGMAGGNTTGNSIMGYGRVLSSPYALSQRSELSAQDFPALGSKLNNSGAPNAYTRTNPSLGAVGSSLAMGMTPTLAGAPSLSASSAGLTTSLGSTPSTLPPVAAGAVAPSTASQSHVPSLTSLPGAPGATATRTEVAEWSTRRGVELNPNARLGAAPSLAGDISGRSSVLNAAAAAAGASVVWFIILDTDKLAEYIFGRC
ncbi:CCR4-NOT transcription complex subunit 2 [Cyanidiococcus yangmingshanensis]|uniref:CCR4-NOT transcription complex subunit 2 n=1 Tax=Cyanidiococcus yangmingshanensis TaxID=2690220 RepID=A0A7J7IEL4_9RHOD|nr:CCR4-NOT transcription complex subunit 2 [Cyanidiococcus yangmingshanensis]